MWPGAKLLGQNRDARCIFLRAVQASGWLACKCHILGCSAHEISCLVDFGMWIEWKFQIFDTIRGRSGLH